MAFRAWFEARYGTPASTGAPPAWVTERMEYSFAVSAAAGDGRARAVRGRVPRRHARLVLVRRRARRDARREAGGPAAGDGRAHRHAGAGALPGHGRRPLVGVRGRPRQLQPHRGRPRRAAAAAARRVRAALQQRLVRPAGRRRARRGLPRCARSSSPTRSASARSSRTTAPPHPSGATGGCSPLSPARQTSLFLPPVLAGSLHGEPIEEVLFLRDELSNLVWAVERLAPSLAGGAFDRDADNRRRPATRRRRRRPRRRRTARCATASRRRCPTTGSRSSRADRTAASPPSACAAPRALLDEGGEPGFSRPLGRILEPERPT